MVRGLMPESEPEAVATGLMLNRCYQHADSRLNVRLFKVDCLTGRYHHPTRAARAGARSASGSDLNLSPVDLFQAYKSFSR
jgi:hypothetical protein